MCELKLYIVGHTSRSERAVVELKALLEANFKGQYSLEIIDIIENPALAAKDRIVATPTVVKASPPPVRRVMGDLGKSEDVLAGLGLTLVGVEVEQTRGFFIKKD